MTSIEDEIRANGEAWTRALLANDAEAVASFMRDDWVYVAPEGITPKTSLIGWIASGRLAQRSFTPVGPERLVILGDTLVLTARRKSTGTWEGVPYAVDEWLSEVFVKTAGRWLCVLSHKAKVEAA